MSTAETATVHLQTLAGRCLASLQLRNDSTLGELRGAAAEAASAGALAVRLLTSDRRILDGASGVSIRELGLQDGTAITVITDRARDYARITAPERVVKTARYPGGILIGGAGELLVSHFFGSLSVYSADFTLIKKVKLPQTEPKQLALAPSGELLVLFPTRVGVFSLSDPEHAVRWFGQFAWARGIAAHGDHVFVSDADKNAVYKHRFADGELLFTAKPGLRKPCGLAVVDDRLLAVADREHDRLVLLDLETLETRSQIPVKGAPDDHVLRRPNDVKVDSGGNLLVMDTSNERIAVFREDGTLLASVMKGFFRDHGNTYSHLCYNPITGAFAASNNDEHCVTVLSPVFAAP